MRRGRFFHKLGAADEKAQSPKIFFSFKPGYFKIRPFSWTEIIARLFFNSNKGNQVNRRITVDSFKSNKKYFKTNTKFDRKPM